MAFFLWFLACFWAAALAAPLSRPEALGAFRGGCTVDDRDEAGVDLVDTEIDLDFCRFD